MLLQDKIYVKRGILVIKNSIYFVDSMKGKLNLFSLSNKLNYHSYYIAEDYTTRVFAEFCNSFN